MMLDASFFKWTSTVSPTRTRKNGPGTLPLNVQYGIGGPIGKLTHDLLCLQVDADGGRTAVADRAGQVGWVADDVRAGGRRGGRA